MRTYLYILSVVAVASIQGAYDCDAATLVNEDFQTDPLFSNGQSDPAFSGWAYSGTGKSRRNDNQSDVPGDNYPTFTNQIMQLEWTNAEPYYDTGYLWSSTNVFTITMNVSPQSWNGGLDRYITPKIEETGGTVLWTGSALMPKYDNFGRNPWTASQSMTFYVYASQFSGGTPGNEIRLKLDHSGQRGIYIDDIVMTDSAPPDNTAPTPDPIAWDMEPAALDYRCISMSCSNALDPSDVEYFFTNTTTGTTSGWQDSTSWDEGNLLPNTSYSYMVKARDKSPNQNETAWSVSRSATTPSEEPGTILVTGFQCPLFGNGTQNPSFSGWTMSSSIRSRRADNHNDGLPGSTSLPNQVIQLEQTSSEPYFDTTFAWQDGQNFTLTINASPQAWNGGNQRYLEPSIRQTDNTVLWSDSVAIPLYDSNFQHNPWGPTQTFTWELNSTDDFSGGTPGNNIRLYIDSSGQRGMFVDNILLKQNLSNGMLYTIR